MARMRREEPAVSTDQGGASPAGEVARALRERIMMGEIPAGARLVQAKIAAEFGVGAGPVHDALRELEAAGMVRIDPRRGAAVYELSRAEA